MLHKDYESKYSVEKKLLVVILKWLVAKTNCNSDAGSEE
jgi:hypothetical protein